MVLDRVPAPRLTACLIVRDEGPRVAACLESLSSLVDEVVVHDTGSVDDTVQVLRGTGAVVVEGSWNDDFAEARNVALELAQGEWVLSVDADEVVSGDADGLRQWLDGVHVDTVRVRIHNLGREGSEGHEHTPVRLFRRAGAAWRGRLHETVGHGGRPSGDAPAQLVPGELLSIEHHGYADEAAQRRKGERNLRLADRALEEVLRDGSATPHEVAVAALNVGRSAIGAGHPQRAVDAFEAVRELLDGGPAWNEATDYLARVLLGAGEPRLALVLTDQLQQAGVSGDYCGWLRAQGLAQTGDPAGALAQVEGVDSIVDPSGRRFDPAPLDRLRELCRELLTAR